jgi:hypothetical protein
LIILLFSILWGGLLTLILCAPFGYYPLFFGIFGVSIVMYVISRRHFKITNKFFYAASLILFFLAYGICTYIIFKPANFHYSSSSNISKDKKAVIFYCEGEMEKYTPYYANYFLEDTPLFLKPFYSLKIKQSYREIGVNTKNLDLLKTASELKTSLLNYKPYYFYAALSGYVPGLKDSIHSAITDGCGEINIINYSPDYDLENKQWVQNILDDVKDLNVSIKFTKPVHSSEVFSDMFISLIKNLPMKFDGLLIIDNVNNTSKRIKDELIQMGYGDSGIQIEENISKAMKYFKETNAQTVFYINLKESSSGINAQIITTKELDKYTKDMKIMGKESWGYDKNLIKSSIDVLLQLEKNPEKDG